MTRGEIRILIAEDSPTQAEQLQYVLEKHGYLTAVAHNGREALEILERYGPALVITDIVMPEMDGFQLCKKVKTDERLKDIPIILLTALSDPEDVLRGLECGADNFITKPYDENYLLARIQHVLINAEMRREAKVQRGVEIFFKGRKYFIVSERQQILDLLLSTYETAVLKNHELKELKEALEALNERLEVVVRERTLALIEEIEERKKVEEELRKHREHLEEIVKERTAELVKINEQLQGEIAERKEAEEEITRLNAKLEQRARDLEVSNEDLESFSYSISHDLKAPLRAIDGFSQVLMDDYAGRLDEEGGRLLNLLRNNARKMGQLIDDVLAFSRAGRKEIILIDVNMEALVNSLLEELRPATAGRMVRFETGSLLPAVGDVTALRQVFSNLLMNAVKFTRPREVAVIEIGCNEKESERVYYVRDNGVGFDMRYAHRLFGVFQRLHSSGEYEGTGIGLAIIKRIITKLGGRVWAEGAVEAGATFYFSLRKPDQAAPQL